MIVIEEKRLRNDLKCSFGGKQQIDDSERSNGASMTWGARWDVCKIYFIFCMTLTIGDTKDSRDK